MGALFFCNFVLSLYVMYLFRKRDPNRPVNTNIKIMHAINAIAIAVFAAGILWKLIDWIL